MKNAQILPPPEFLVSHFPMTATFPVGRDKRELSQGISNTMIEGNFKNVPCACLLLSGLLRNTIVAWEKR